MIIQFAMAFPLFKPLQTQSSPSKLNFYNVSKYFHMKYKTIKNMFLKENISIKSPEFLLVVVCLLVLSLLFCV